MAFDMSLKDKSEKIHYDEEDFFIIITREEGFPNLDWLWDNFYRSPRIYGDRSKAIAMELEKAKEIKSIKSRKHFLAFIDRVKPFFQESFDSNTVIMCVSD